MSPFEPWPVLKPELQPIVHGWLSHEHHFARLLKGRTEPRVLEIGTFFGKTALHLASTYKDLLLVCVDPWASYKELTKYDMEDVRNHWIANLWDYKDRVQAIRMSSHIGVISLLKFGFIPDIVYVDGAHDELSATLDITVSAIAFPEAKLCGDDFNMPGVRSAVTKFAKEHNKRIAHDIGHSSFWEYL